MSGTRTTVQARWTQEPPGVRETLERMRAEMRVANAAETEELATPPDERGEDVTPSQHPADVASDLERRELLLTRRLIDANGLAEIDAAIARLDAGTYGICVDCGRLIPPERLEALPQAARDVACESRRTRRT